MPAETPSPEGNPIREIPELYNPEALRIPESLLRKARSEMQSRSLEIIGLGNDFVRIEGASYPKDGRENQDSMLGYCRENFFAAAVIDGNGESGAREASQALREGITRALQALPEAFSEMDVVQAVEEASREARKKVPPQGDAALALVFALRPKGRLMRVFTMHAADCRVYWNSRRITKDQSPVEEGFYGRLTPLQAKIHPRRNIVYGGALTFSPEGKTSYQISSLETHGNSFPATAILATDGFHDNFFDDPLPGMQVADIQLNGGLGPEADPEDLLIRARARGHQGLRSGRMELSKPDDDVTVLKIVLRQPVPEMSTIPDRTSAERSRLPEVVKLEQELKSLVDIDPGLSWKVRKVIQFFVPAYQDAAFAPDAEVLGDLLKVLPEGQYEGKFPEAWQKLQELTGRI